MVDAQGNRRIEERTAPSLGLLGAPAPKPAALDRREDWSLQKEAAKQERASGGLPEAYLARLAAGGDPSPATRPRGAAPSRPQPALSGAEWSVREEAERSLASEPLPPQAPIPLKTPPAVRYAPLHLLSGHALGRSTMLAEELAHLAAHAGCPAAAIADPFSLGGALEFSRGCARVGVRPLVGASFELVEGGGEIVLVARSRRGYVSLSHLITACHLGEPRGFPLATWERLEAHSAGLLCLTGGDVGPLDRLLVRRDFDAARRLVERLASIYGRANTFLEVDRSLMPWSMHVERRILELAEATGTTAVAGGTVAHARRSHYPAQDVLACAWSLCTLEEVVGRKARRHPGQPQAPNYPLRSLNAERFFRSSAQMAAHYADRPELLEATLRVAERCEDDVLPGRARLPSLHADDDHALREIVASEAHGAYGSGLTPNHRKRLAMEVDRIQRQGYSSHFLIAHEVARYAREHAIGMSGRGSVVDSAVAYVLGLSEIDAMEWDLHFDRFLPEDASKRPDIDIDFEASRRDQVRGFMVRRFGVERVAGLAAVQTFDTKGIVRAVGKAVGMPQETVSALAKALHGGVSPDRLEAALASRPELRDADVPKERFRLAFKLGERMMGVPRAMGLHSAGVVVTDAPLADFAPVVWSASAPHPESGVDEPFMRMVQWDKGSLKHVVDKYDCLCLRGQDTIAGVERRLQAADPSFSSKRLNATTDPRVFEQMRSGELVGVPQSASPAMRQAHQRLRTRNLREASMVQAGIRPGVGSDRLNVLIARKLGQAFLFEHEDLARVLGQTYGVLVYQEQCDRLLQLFCGYSGAEAESIRDSLYKKRRHDYAGAIRAEVVAKAVARGYAPAVADRVFELVAQWKGYGFSEGHALAFSEISLRSVSLMQNYPAFYFASLLSAQPAGYYGPDVLATECRMRGVRILPLDVNRSRLDFEVEDVVDETGLVVPNGGVRIGLMQLKGLSARTRDRILEAQEAALGSIQGAPLQPLASPHGGGVAVAVDGAGARPEPPRAFRSIFDLAARVQPSLDELDALILSGALDSLHPNRRAMLWVAQEALDLARGPKRKTYHPTLDLDFGDPPLDDSLEDLSRQEKAVHERLLLGMDVDDHLMAFERGRAREMGCVTTAEARRLPPGTRARVVGNPIRLRFPPTASGKRVCFFDVCDEFGLLNATVFSNVYDRCGHAIVRSQYVVAEGVIQHRDGCPAFLVRSVVPYEPCLLEEVAKAPIDTADFLAK